MRNGTLIVMALFLCYGWYIWPKYSFADINPATAKQIVDYELSLSDYFGFSVSVAGDTAVVSDLASAYVFGKSTTSWIQQEKIEVTDSVPSDWFGMSVSVSGDTIVIGAPGEASNGITHSGAVYIFVKSGNSWTQQKKLTPPVNKNWGGFGWSVAVSGDTVVIGQPTFPGSSNPGAISIYVRSGTSWIEEAQIDDPTGNLGDGFGWSVAIEGDSIVVGAPYAYDLSTPSAGALYVFVRSGTSWTQQARLTAEVSVTGDELGYSVSLSGDTVVAGAPDANNYAGEAHVFVRSGTAWSEQAELKLIENDPYDLFGSSVSISDDTIIIGAPKCEIEGNPIDSGAAYEFVRSETSWAQQATLLPSVNNFQGFFGRSVAVYKDTAIIGGRNFAYGYAGFRNKNNKWQPAAWLLLKGKH